jgi:EAL domain-containing protein (putative c-di-GMP-specific phosphodiesterase class I)
LSRSDGEMPKFCMTPRVSPGCVEVCVENFSEVCNSFSQEWAGQIVSEVARSLFDLLDENRISHVELERAREDRFSFMIANDADLLVLHACFVAVASRPVIQDQVSILPILSLTQASNIENFGGGSGRRSVSTPFFACRPWSDDRDRGASAAAYAADMLPVVNLVSGIRDNALQFTWQPVRQVDDKSGLLYRELSLCRLHENGSTVSVQDEIVAAERLGASPLVDCLIVSRAIDELAALPDLVVGVRVSSLSAKPGFWWLEVMSRLAQDQTLGPRLIFEIGGTAPLAPIAEINAFLDRMRGFGCSVVIDDFGIDYSSIRSIMAIKPDGVRIAPLFLQRAQLTDADQNIFNGLVGLAKAMCETVIANGVENARACQIATQAGAKWQQGRHHGSPSQIHSWGNRRRGLDAGRNRLSLPSTELAAPLTPIGAVAR